MEQNELSIVEAEEQHIDEMISLEDAAQEFGFTRQWIKQFLDELEIKPQAFKKNPGARDTPLYARSVLKLGVSKHKTLVDYNGLKQESSKQAFEVGFALPVLLEAIRDGAYDERKQAVAQLEQALPGMGTAYADQVATASHFMLTDHTNRRNLESNVRSQLAHILRMALIHGDLVQLDYLKFASEDKYNEFANKLIRMYFEGVRYGIRHTV
jgi:hypothetical protein